MKKESLNYKQTFNNQFINIFNDLDIIPAENFNFNSTYIFKPVGLNVYGGLIWLNGDNKISMADTIKLDDTDNSILYCGIVTYSITDVASIISSLFNLKHLYDSIILEYKQSFIKNRIKKLNSDFT